MISLRRLSAPLGQALPRMRADVLAPKISTEPWERAKRRFRAIRFLGAGSFGEAYSATLEGIRVIVKRAMGTPGAVSMKEAFDTLKREIAVLGKLQKFPFVPRLLEVGPDYFVQEDVGGEAMILVLARRGMEAREILSTTIATGVIISLIHREGLSHGDLAPRNILLTPQGVVVIDFGLAVARSEDEAKWRENVKHDVTCLLEQVALAATSRDLPEGAKAVLAGILEKFRKKLLLGEFNEYTAGELARELFFVTAQLGARHERGRRLVSEKIRVAVI